MMISRAKGLRTRIGWLGEKISTNLCPSRQIFKGKWTLQTNDPLMCQLQYNKYIPFVFQGKQSWYRFGGDTSRQETKIPGSTEEDGLTSCFSLALRLPEHFPFSMNQHTEGSVDGTVCNVQQFPITSQTSIIISATQQNEILQQFYFHFLIFAKIIPRL